MKLLFLISLFISSSAFSQDIVITPGSSVSVYGTTVSCSGGGHQNTKLICICDPFLVRSAFLKLVRYNTATGEKEEVETLATFNEGSRKESMRLCREDLPLHTECVGNSLHY